MVKGIQKQLVVFRTNGSPYYEEAYFVLREGRNPAQEAASTMMAEANRILDACFAAPQVGRRRRLGHRTLFILGMAAGVIVGCGVMCLLWALL